MTDPKEFDPIARELRASLERHAREAPRGDLLAERILNETERAPRRTRRSWRTWSLPLVAAGAVAAAVIGAVAGVQSLQTSAHGPTPGTSGSGSVLQSPVSPTGTPSNSPSATSSVAPVASDTLHHVKIVDLTFVSENQGWALASADCVHGSGTCSALFHMKGTQWWSMPNSTPFNVPGDSGGCTYPCVTNIRFANKDVGYAFGPGAFLMTQDGGHNWTKPDPTGAIALESLDNNVIRVIASSPDGCPGPCNVQVETAAIGSTDWTMSDLAPLSGGSFSLSRGQPSNAYLLMRRNPAGGAQNETSTLYRSTDDGAHWTSVGEPCQRRGGEVDSYAVAGGGPGGVSVLCATRMAPQRWYVATSTDGGADFAASFGTVPAHSTPLLTGDAASVLVAAGHGLSRSTDGGATWHSAPSVSGDIGFVGFESTRVGRAVSSDGKTIWTTRDGGGTWTPDTFG